MKQLWILLFVFSSSVGFSQNEANIWYFGENAGLDFNSGSPVALLDGALNTLEGCSTISDTDGNLLFYSDGVTVWNRNHQIMLNGTGLNGHASSTHSALVVPKPDSSTIYYIFTVDQAVVNNNGIQYSEVDMSLDNGLGGITSTKNIPLYAPTTEKLTAVKKFSGNGFWVLSHKFNSNEFIAYDVTASGVSTNPMISAIGTVVSDSEGAIGQIKISPNGTKVAVASRGNIYNVQIFDFNATTGTVSNLLTFQPNTTGVYGVEFSPNSDVLYVSGLGGRVYQLNLDAGSNSDILNSQILIQNNNGVNYSAIQLGPDGKLYITKLAGYLDVVDNPNIVGLGCNYIVDGVYLEGRLGQLGLPPFIQSFFFVGFQAEDVCLGEITNFNANISQSFDSILWDFGDGIISTDENPTHIYTISGDYNVSLTVTANGEISNDSKIITIYDVPNVNPLVELKQCDDDLDGFSAFNLNEAIDEITSNASNETITFFETQFQAQNNDNPLTNLTSYTNQTVSSDSIWARIENANGCYRISQINLFVSTTQIPNTYTKDFYKCDDDNDGVAVFDFSSVTPEIESMFPSGQQLIISYYKNQSDALAENNPIVDITNYQNIGYPNTQNIYIRVDSELDNDCLGLGHHITLHVESVPIAYSVSAQQQCDDDGDGMYAFDTTSIQNSLLNGQTDITVTYTDGMGNALPSPLSNPFLTASQTITATLINANSQHTDGACNESITISFIVEPVAIAYPIQDLVFCDDDSDGFYEFDTSTIESTLLNGQTGLQVFYTNTYGTVLPSPLPNPFYTQSQSIIAKVQSATSNYCFDETTINFVVNISPIAYPIKDDFICDDISNDGEQMFQLSIYKSQILNGQSDSVYEVFYFDSLVNAESNSSPLPNNYLVNSTSETIFARIQNTANSNCYDTTSFELGVAYMPVTNQPQDLHICDDESNDGFEEFNLTSQNNIILNGQSSTENIISYYLSQQDADTDINRISELYTNTENPQTVYVRLENNNNPNCFDTTSFDMNVLETPVLFMSNLWAICEGNSVDLIADDGFDEYLWSTGETTRIITVDTVGEYNVTATNNYGGLRCEATKNISVTQSSNPIITNIETIDWSENNNEITVLAEGNGDYEYSLDGINYQDSNQFNNLPMDDYTVYVKNVCGIVTEEIYLLFYPKFLTPNNDSFHDTWQLYNSNKEPNNKIYIYDRYGKLLKQINPMDSGWDGSFNGNPLPTNDYWFLLERQNGKTYRGHFTLKR